MTCCQITGLVLLITLLSPIILAVVILILLIAVIAGLILAPIFGVLVIAGMIKHNYYSKRTRDAKGVYLVEDMVKDYMRSDVTFTSEDKSRLENELIRLNIVTYTDTYIKYFFQTVKLIIPIGGLIWAINTELEGNGSMELGCQGCMQHWTHWSPEEAVQYHLGRFSA